MMVKFKKTIFTSLISKYIVFSIVLILSLIVTFVLGSNIFNYYFGKNEPQILAGQLIRPDYQNIDMKDVEALDGWIEILDRDYHVIHILGDKRDTRKTYSAKDIFDIQDPNGTSNYYGNIQAFEDEQGQERYLLVKYLGKNVNLNIAPTYEFVSQGNLKWIILTCVAFMIILYLISIILFAKKTSKMIKEPLDKIKAGILNVSKGNMEYRLEFEAREEFTLIRDYFNNMMDSVENYQNENAKLQQSKFKLMADLSHDIKTPLTSIMTFTEALKSNIVPEEKKMAYYETIYNKSLRVNELVSQLFYYIKLENADYIMHKTDVDIVELTRSILADYYEELEKAGLSLEPSIQDKEIIITVDDKLLGRVISNLIENAIKYNPSKTTLYVRLFETKGEVVLEVEDDGVGIEDNIADSIFDPFVRGDQSRSSLGGTGLGLSVVKKIVQMHQGSVNYERPEKGSKFVIRLPK